MEQILICSVKIKSLFNFLNSSFFTFKHYISQNKSIFIFVTTLHDLYNLIYNLYQKCNKLINLNLITLAIPRRGKKPVKMTPKRFFLIECQFLHFSHLKRMRELFVDNLSTIRFRQLFSTYRHFSTTFLLSINYRYFFDISGRCPPLG